MAARRRVNEDTVKLLGAGSRPVIHVTAEMIAAAIPKDSSHCMISDAIRAAYPDVTTIATDLQTVRWSVPKKRERYIYLTPRSVQQALVDFDAGKPVKPFKFELRTKQTVLMKDPAERKARAQAALDLTPDAAPPPQAKPDQRRMRSSGLKEGKVPDIVGGRAPPRLPGTRREYGLRALVR